MTYEEFSKFPKMVDGSVRFGILMEAAGALVLTGEPGECACGACSGAILNVRHVTLEGAEDVLDIGSVEARKLAKMLLDFADAAEEGFFNQPIAGAAEA